MPIAVLIRDNAEERDYQISGNRIITLKLDDDQITFWENGLKMDGEFVFMEIEGEHDSSYLLRRMYVPQELKRRGLGRAAVEFFKEYYKVEVFARTLDGIERDDQSHLTEDAQKFVNPMIEDGVLLDNRDTGGGED